ncbi:hypothetical protein MMC13_002885 [Lambiella insularis]|nr:hypothetical protein [Lambiella insularis]
MVELHPDVLRQAVEPDHKHHHHKHADEGGVVVVDSLEACLKEAGEVIQAGITPEQLVEVGELLMVKKAAKKEKEMGGRGELGLKKWLIAGNVIYKSVGLGVMDLCVGEDIVLLAREKGVAPLERDLLRSNSFFAFSHATRKPAEFALRQRNEAQETIICSSDSPLSSAYLKKSRSSRHGISISTFSYLRNIVASHPPTLDYASAANFNARSNRFSSAKVAEHTARDPKPLFFYGTLMFPSILASILADTADGRPPRSYDHVATMMTPAKLYNYDRVAVGSVNFQLFSLFLPKVQMRQEVIDNGTGMYDLTPVQVEVVVEDEVDGGGSVRLSRSCKLVDAEVYVWTGA